MAETPVRRIAADQLTAAESTPGLVRREAVVLPGLWSGRARTEPGVTSGWHHHGAHDTVVYVVSGAFQVETFEGVVEAFPGDFVHVPAYSVHRESNPSPKPAEVVVVRAGTGPVVVNVDGPSD